MNCLKSLCHSVKTLVMQLLTWQTSQLVMGSLGGGPACVIGKYSNKHQLLKSYSCIEVNWENIGNYFLSRLFFSSLKVPGLQKHITAGHERATVCPISNIMFLLPEVWRYPTSLYIQPGLGIAMRVVTKRYHVPSPLTVWTVMELTYPVTDVQQGVQNKETNVFCFCKFVKQFMKANQGP